MIKLLLYKEDKLERFMVKKIGRRLTTILVSALTICLLYLWAFKPWLREPSKEDLFFEKVAVDFNAPDICDKIHPYAHWVAMFSPTPIGYYHSECYEQVALKTHNEALCDKVKPLKTLFHFIGSSGMSKSSCIEEIQRGITPISPGGDYKLSEMLPRVGFTEAKIRSYPYFVHFPKDIPAEQLFIEFYSKLEFGYVPGKDEFLAGVRKL